MMKMNEQITSRNPRPLRVKFDPESQTFYEEMLQDPAWLRMGYVPAPASRLGWFLHHVIHGLLMRYPLTAVLRWSWQHSRPEDNVPEPMKPDWRTWVYLEPPKLDLRQGDELVPYAFDSGDGWIVSWGVRHEGDDYIEPLGDAGYDDTDEMILDFWPFAKDTASYADWCSIGFEVV